MCIVDSVNFVATVRRGAEKKKEEDDGDKKKEMKNRIVFVGCALTCLHGFHVDKFLPLFRAFTNGLLLRILFFFL